MSGTNQRFALIARDGTVYYPYQKSQRATGRYGFALTRPGEGDRQGGGTYTTSIEEVVKKVVLDGWSVRARSEDKIADGSIGFGKRIITNYWVAPELRSLVASAVRQPLTALPTGDLGASTILSKAIQQAEESGTREEETVLRAILTRRGQPRFRAALIHAYGGKCCVTGCDIVEVLEAAHIVPHSMEVDYEVTNGLLLRSDIHVLFDLGLLSIDDNYQIRLSPDLVQGDYSRLQGKHISTPADRSKWPDQQRLRDRVSRLATQREEA